MHPNQRTLAEFYGAFAKKDWATMVNLYAADVHFTDRVFDLHGAAAAAMWRMLCEQGVDLEVRMTSASADEREGVATWEADYTFSATGRRVKNRVSARFEFRDGKIVRHVDDFDFWKWAAQALGPIGLILGWSSFVQRKVQRVANDRLKAFMVKTGPAVLDDRR